MSALSESLKVELVKFGEGFTANTEPRQHVLQGVETRQQAPVKWRRYSPDHKDESRDESYGGMKILALLGVTVRVCLRAPVDENKIVSTTKSLQSVYDNVYDMILCIRLTKRKVVVVTRNNENSRLKNYCHFFSYAPVSISIDNTRVFLNNQPMHMCGGLVYSRR